MAKYPESPPSYSSSETTNSESPPSYSSSETTNAESPPSYSSSETTNDYEFSDDNSFVFHCFSLSHIKKSHLENGNRIIMPASTIDTLMSRRKIKYPMTFKITNLNFHKVSHCGVLEFTAEEGCVYIPNWMMDSLLLQEGQLVEIENTGTLAKATYMKIQPHTTDFVTNISDPKAVLEKILRDFACLTVGDTIMVNYNDQSYHIDIVEANPGNVVSLFETDCEVDFAQPLDYKEPDQIKPEEGATKHQELEANFAKFEPFTGNSRRLDEKTSSTSTSIVAKTELNADTNARKYAGTVVFGPEDDNGGWVQNKKRRITKVMEDVKEKKTDNSEEKKKTDKIEEKKFQPFTGKKYTLS